MLAPRVKSSAFSGGGGGVSSAVELNIALQAYAELYRETYGEAEPVAALIPDGPFVERSGNPIGPGDVLAALGEVAALKGMPVEALRKQVVRNLRNLLATTSCQNENGAGTI